jgi:hypothetical protein
VAAAARYHGDAKNTACARLRTTPQLSSKVWDEGDHDQPPRTGHSRHRH